MINREVVPKYSQPFANGNDTKNGLRELLVPIDPAAYYPLRKVLKYSNTV